MTATRLFRLLLAPLAVLIAMLATTGAGASPPSPASGNRANTSSVFNSVRTAGDNVIIDLTATVAYTGTFSGTSIVEGTLIIHGDGSANFHEVETFTGQTANGVPGTVTFNLNGIELRDLAVDATDTIVGATGELAGLHGVLHIVATVAPPRGPVGTYTGKIGDQLRRSVETASSRLHAPPHPP